MKKPTNVDVIDTSWKWIAGDNFYWDGEALRADIPDLDKTPIEKILDWNFGRSYQPLRENTALFIEFAHTPTTKAGILDFARQYGDLDHGYPKYRTKKQWTEAITEMRDTVDLWQALEGGEGAGIGRNAVRTNLLQKWPQLLGAPKADEEPVTRSVLLDRCRKALYVRVNLMLSRYKTVASLALTPNSDFQLTFRPENLLGAMWLQFAQAMAHNYAIRICKGCKKPFQAGAGALRRGDAITCSDACRQKAYRASKTAE